MPYFVGQRSRHDRTDPIPVMHLYHSNSFVKFRWKMPSEIQIPNSNRRKDPGSESINIDDGGRVCIKYIHSSQGPESKILLMQNIRSKVEHTHVK